MIQNPFRSDFWLKMGAVALAIILWAVVTQLNSEETARTFTIPLSVVPHPSFEIYDGPLDGERTVTLEVHGASVVLRTLSASDFSAVADYSEIGQHGRRVDVPVRITYPDYVRVQVEPRTLSVLLVENSVVEVAVQVLPTIDTWIIGEREYAITVRGPDVGTLRGRSDYLRDVASAMITVVPEDIRGEIARNERGGQATLSKRLVPVDTGGRQVPNVELNFADVVVNWEQLPYGKMVQVRAGTRGVPAQGYALVRTAVEPESIIIRSASPEDPPPPMAVVETMPLDLSGRTTSFTTEMPLLLEQGITASVETVKVTVTVQEQTIDRDLTNIPIQVIGRSNTQAVTLGQDTITLRVRGPYTLVNALQSTDFVVTADIEGREAGLNLIKVKVTGPAGTHVEADPALVEVMILEAGS